MSEYDYFDLNDDVEDEFDELIVYCVLPVVEQVTAVFLKLFGLSAIVSIIVVKFNCMSHASAPATASWIDHVI